MSTTPDPQYVELLRRYRAAGGIDLREQLHARYLELGRGGTTASGLPYPDPSDPVAEGADAIRALAEAIELNLDSPAGTRSRATGVSVASSTDNTEAPLDAGTLEGGIIAAGNGLILPRSGWYTITAQTIWTANTSGRRGIQIAANGVSTGLGTIVTPVAVNSTVVLISGQTRLAAGDVLTLNRWQNAGAALVELSAFLTAVWLR